jgi:hypothetical protein
MPNWKKLIVSGSDASLNSLIVANGVTGSLFGTSSWAVSASFAQTAGNLLAGNSTASFTSSSTWNFTHNLSSSLVILQTYDTSYNQIIPENIALVGSSSAVITFPQPVSGYAVASLGGNIGITVAQSGSTATTASYALQALSASYALTASYVANASSFPYTGSAIISGSLQVTGSLSVTGSNASVTSPSFIVGTGAANQTFRIVPSGSSLVFDLYDGSNWIRLAEMKQ